MITPPQPTGEPAGLIRKYYPSLGLHLPSPTLPELAGEWFSDLCRMGAESVDYYGSGRLERASNKAELLACLAMLLAEAEQYAHLPGYGYRQHYPPDYLTPEQESELEASGRTALLCVREWHTQASLSPIEQFLHRARKIELCHNERHQLATREARREEWNEEYGVMLLTLQRAVPSVKKKLLRAAYTELKRLLPTIEASQPLEWQRLADEGRPFFPIVLKNTYIYSEFAPLRPTQNTERQITESFFVNLYLHLFEKEWHVWQALILLAGVLGEPAPVTPETFQEKQIEPSAPALDSPPARPLDTPAPQATTAPPAGDTPTVAAYPWTEIEALAVRIELRKAGRFTPATKLVASAVAGLIDALREAKMLPAAATLPILYAAFKDHYKCSVGVDRINDTRGKWQRTARKELGLD